MIGYQKLRLQKGFLIIIFWCDHIKKILNNAKKIDVKIGNKISPARQVDFNRKRIYIGADIKGGDCDTVRISITSKYIDIKCK